MPALALGALGISSSYLLWVAAPLVNPAHTALYHWSGPASRLFAPVIIDLLVVAILLLGLLRSAARPGRWRAAVWGGIMLFTPSIELKNIAYIENVVPWHVFSVVLGVSAALAWVVLILSWGTRFQWRLEPPIAAAQTLFIFMGVGGVLLLGELGYFAWQGHAVDRLTIAEPAPAPRISETKKSRIIWIVFDELSYQQVYANRFPGLKLPAFDALAAESTVFSDTIPAGDHTEYVLPALFSGKPLDAVRSTASGQLLVQLLNHPQFTAFKPNDSVFSDARKAGYTTAIAGWYNPYCRILPALFESCYWTYDERLQNGMYPSASILTNTLQPLVYLASAGAPQRVMSHFLPVRAATVLNSRRHIEDFQQLDRAAVGALDDSSANFVLLHMPVPHPGSIFSRSSGKVTDAENSYIDNLAMTDRCLASIRAVLEHSGQWDNSTLVIMGDHSWRTYIWRDLPAWSREDEQASNGGEFDPRPFYVVKLAGQHSGATVATPFHALNTRSLLDQLFAKQISTPEELLKWARQAQ